MGRNDIILLLGLGFLFFRPRKQAPTAQSALLIGPPAAAAVPYVSQTGAQFIPGTTILVDEEGYTSPEADIEPIDYVERTRFRRRNGSKTIVDDIIDAIIPDPAPAPAPRVLPIVPQYRSVEEFREGYVAPKTAPAYYTVESYREALR